MLLGHPGNSVCGSKVWSESSESHRESLDSYVGQEGREREKKGAHVWMEEELAEKHEVKYKERCGKKKIKKRLDILKEGISRRSLQQSQMLRGRVR